MHVIVVGCGRVGSEVALNLAAAEHDVVVIDRRIEAFRRLGDDFKGTTMVGVGFDRDVLTEAGITPDCAVAAVTSGDNSNILIARVARETFGVEHVVARIYDPRRASIYERLGHRHGRHRWRGPALGCCATCWHRTPHPTGSTRRPSSPSSNGGCLPPAAGHVGGQARGSRQRPSGRARRDSARRRSRRRRLLLQEDDVLHVVIPADNAAAARGGTAPQRGIALMNVIIAGAGSVGRYMAGQLQDSGHSVTLIDNDPNGRRPGPGTRTPVGVTWCLGDACEVATLAAVGAAQADVVAAVTGDDEDNLVVSLLSKQEFAVPRVWLGSTTRRTSGCSTTCGVSTSRSRHRICSPAWSRKPSRSARSFGCSASRAARPGSPRSRLAAGLAGDRQGAHRPRPAPRVDRRRRAPRRPRRRAPRRHRAASGRRGVGAWFPAASKTTSARHWWADDVAAPAQAADDQRPTLGTQPRVHTDRRDAASPTSLRRAARSFA